MFFWFWQTPICTHLTLNFFTSNSIVLVCGIGNKARRVCVIPPHCASLWSHSLHMVLNWWNRTMAWWLDWSGLPVPKNPVWKLYIVSDFLGGSAHLSSVRFDTYTLWMHTLGNLPPLPSRTTREGEIGPNFPVFSHIYTSCLCTSVRLDGVKKERKEIHHFLATWGFACEVLGLNTPLSSLV